MSVDGDKTALARRRALDEQDARGEVVDIETATIEVVRVRQELDEGGVASGFYVFVAFQDVVDQVERLLPMIRFGRWPDGSWTAGGSSSMRGPHPNHAEAVRWADDMAMRRAVEAAVTALVSKMLLKKKQGDKQ